MQLSIVVPAYQEQDRLPGSLAQIERFLLHSERSYEIVVVDDGSTDGTRFATDGFESQFRTLVLPKNRGKGAAVKAGVLDTTGDRVLITDADLSTPIEELATLEAALATSPIAFGSRALARDLIGQRQPFYRETMGSTFNLLLRLLGFGGVRDTQCGFKLIEGKVARDLFAEMTIDGFAFDVELLVLARKRGISVQEVAVVWNHVEYSRVDPVTHSAQMLWDVLKLRLRSR